MSSLLYAGVLRLFVCFGRMLVSFLGVFVSEGGVLMCLLVVALLVVFCRCVVCLGSVFVVLGCLAMCFVCHRAPLVPGKIPAHVTLSPLNKN